jgi:PAS domain S-box-containing protein
MKISQMRLPYIAALAVFLSFSSLFLLIKTTTHQHHNLLETSAYKSVQRGLKREQKSIESVTRDFAWWDDSIINTVLNPNVGWVSRNLGSYLYKNFEIDYVSVLNDELLPLYQFSESRIFNAPLILSNSLKNILITAQNAEYISDDEGPKVISGIAVIHNKVMLVSVSRLKQEAEDIESDLFESSLLIVGKQLGDSFLEKMRYELNLKHLELIKTLDHAHDMSSLEIENYNEETIAHLHMLVPDTENSTSIAMYISLLILGLSSLLTLGIAFKTVRTLREKYVAIDQLNTEVSERKKAQDRVEVFQEGLKQEVEMRTFELKEEQQQLLSIFNASADGIITIDEKGIIQRLNPAVSSLFGYQESELVGVNIELLLCAQDRKHHQNYIDESTLYSARIINKTRQLWALHKDGHEFAIDLNVAPIKGDKKGFVGVVRDISDRVELEKEREKAAAELKNVIETTAEGFIKFNNEGVIEQVNNAFCEMLGKTSNGLIGKKFHQLIHKDDLNHFFNEKKLCDVNGQHSCQIKLNTSSMVGKFLIKATRVYSDKNIGEYYFAFISDITENYHYQKQLLAARNEAEKANLAKSEFLSSMSHELRTPLNAIIGFAQLLSSSKREVLSDRQNTQVSHIFKGGQHLLTLINDILDLSKIESGKISLSIEPVDPIPVIKECLSFVKGLAEDKQVKLYDVECKNAEYLIDTDRTRLKQVLLNLINNAIKYNVKNGSVSLGVYQHMQYLKILVTDTGIGIPNNLQEGLFKPFSRLGNENSEIEGTGIGLALTKKLVEEIGGKVGFESIESKGSTFWVEFPISQEEKEIERASKEDLEYVIPSSLKNGHHILYIEDNPANQELMRQLLEEHGDIELSIADNAEQGLQIAFNKSPELVLMDINLPGMNGIDATKLLKTTPETSHIPVIVVSANAMDSMKKKAKSAGCDDYLTKPIHTGDLQKLLSIYLPKEDS